MSRRKLLLADDSITIQKVVNLTFADEGIEVIAVGDGNSALDRMQETPPDLVMADVNMPGLSGYDLCERVKQDERLRHIPVILLVGSFEPFDEAEAARVGADDFLTKPFQSIRQLVNKVTGMLETTESRRAATANTAADNSFADASVTGAENIEASTDNFSVIEPAASYDAGAADDEMIETSRVASFPLDEAQKFESRTFDADDAGKTQPLSARDLKDFAFVEEAAREFQSNERTYDAAEESSVVEASAENQPEAASAAPRPAPPVFDFDDFNLLEIPFDEEDEEPAVDTGAADSASATSAEHSSSADSAVAETRAPAESQTEFSSGAPAAAESFSAEPKAISGDDAEEAEFVEEIREAEEGKTIAETEAEAGAETEIKSGGEVFSSEFSFPPELIDAIAQKVAEKLSAQTAGEVAPRVADLIMQKMAEEKLKQ